MHVCEQVCTLQRRGVMWSGHSPSTWHNVGGRQGKRGCEVHCAKRRGHFKGGG